jgi:hypothetical protein
MPGKDLPEVSGTPFQKSVEILKADSELGLVFGWAIVSSENGEPYVDRQGDWIPEEAMLKRADEFACSARTLGVQHEGDDRGGVVFLWPMTPEIEKAMGIGERRRSGLMIAARPDKETLERVRSGELRNFSIGGVRFQGAR